MLDTSLAVQLATSNSQPLPTAMTEEHYGGTLTQAQTLQHHQHVTSTPPHVS